MWWDIKARVHCRFSEIPLQYNKKDFDKLKNNLSNIKYNMCMCNSSSPSVFSVQHLAMSESSLTSCDSHINYACKTASLN